MPKSRIARSATAASIRPSRARAASVATTMCSASISKCRRRASRVSLRPNPSVPRSFTPLGTDGFGRSDTREALRRHFEIDAEHIVVAALAALARENRIDATVVDRAIRDFSIDPERGDPREA